MTTKQLYCNKFDLIYYHCPKNGLKSMSANCFDNGGALMSLNWVEDYPKDKPVVFVYREPMSRFVTVWTFASTFMTKRLPGCRNKGYERGHGVRRDMSVKAEAYVSWLDQLATGNPYTAEALDCFLDSIDEQGFWDDHLSPQMRYLDSVVDFSEYNVGGFCTDRKRENVTEFVNIKDLDQWLKNKGVQNPVRRNQGSYDKAKAREICESRRRRIEQIYAADFALFSDGSQKDWAL